MKTFSATILSIMFVQAIMTNPNTINDVFAQGNHTSMPSIQANAETFGPNNPVFGEWFKAEGVQQGAVPDAHFLSDTTDSVQTVVFPRY